MKTTDERNVIIYGHEGGYGGWPANCGIWSWDNEILVGFVEGSMSDREYGFHRIDRSKPQRSLFGYSKDGGESWVINEPNAEMPAGRGFGGAGGKFNPIREVVDFTSPDFFMSVRMTRISGGGRSLIYRGLSRDGTSWKPWGIVPGNGVSARTDYVVIDANTCLLLGSADKADGREGRPFCCVSEDGGLSWKHRSWFFDDPDGFAIMPSTVRGRHKEDKGALITAIRMKDFAETKLVTIIPGVHKSEAVQRERIFLIRFMDSQDQGHNWNWMKPAILTGDKAGNPPDLIRLTDGRLCLTYGYRQEVFSIRARVADDVDGLLEADDLILRHGTDSHDIGYCRSVQRPDGKVVTVYYWCDSKVGDRRIEATIWNPTTQGETQ